MEKIITKRPLLYYLFDWDDNILNMSTTLRLDRLVNGIWVTQNVDSKEFTKLRHSIKAYNDGEKSEWRYADNNSEIAYSEFRDIGIRGDNAFLEDTINAIGRKDFGPVWGDFIECLVNGSLFGIVTARGHEPNTIKKTVKWIIYNYLTINEFKLLIKNLKYFNVLFNKKIDSFSNVELIDNYLDICDFASVSSFWFAKKYNTDEARSTTSPEKYKIMIIKDFINKINMYGIKLNKKIKIGFSDDDINNITTVYDYFKYKLSDEFPNIEFNAYHTFKDGKYKIN